VSGVNKEDSSNVESFNIVAKLNDNQVCKRFMVVNSMIHLKIRCVICSLSFVENS